MTETVEAIHFSGKFVFKNGRGHEIGYFVWEGFADKSYLWQLAEELDCMKSLLATKRGLFDSERSNRVLFKDHINEQGVAGAIQAEIVLPDIQSKAFRDIFFAWLHDQAKEICAEWEPTTPEEDAKMLTD